MKEQAVAIITARGGSKRIPGKNKKMFCGKPILEYSIEAAMQSGIFSEVMVSTDDEEIKKIALSKGARVPFMRSEKTSNDFAPTVEVLAEVLEEYKKIGKNFNYMACIYPTAPFVTPEKLKKAFSLLKEKDATQVMPVVGFSFPPLRGMVIEEDELMMKWPEHRYTRSQDLETLYHDCGQFYFYDVEKFLAAGGRVESNIVPLVMPELEVQDIDNESDWKIAEIKYQLMKEKIKNE